MGRRCNRWWLSVPATKVRIRQILKDGSAEGNNICTVHKKILFLRNRKVGKIQVIKISVVSNMENKFWEI